MGKKGKKRKFDKENANGEILQKRSASFNSRLEKRNILQGFLQSGRRIFCGIPAGEGARLLSKREAIWYNQEKA